MVQAFAPHTGTYERRRPEQTALYYVVRDNLETLYGAIGEGALDIKLGEHAKKELEAYPDYVLRPPIAQECIVPQNSGLVANTLKRAYADGTVAVEMDPLSLLCRLAMSVPPPRYPTVKYAGVLAAASKLRARIAPAPAPPAEPPRTPRRGSYWPWALLMRRTFGLDVLQCPWVDRDRRRARARD